MKLPILGRMNTMEVIDYFKRLPEDEQGKVVEFIRKDSSTKVRYADDDAAKAAGEAVFGEHPELFRKLAQ
ncbi:MAG: hypothetical protein MK080_10300 [Opitutales bacterium]|nr:hypothetical protein [Opitutales bacterium]NRA28572.1 hypothetical protein [Opitutales bacterium]